MREFIAPCSPSSALGSAFRDINGLPPRWRVPLHLFHVAPPNALDRCARRDGSDLGQSRPEKIKYLEIIMTISTCAQPHIPNSASNTALRNTLYNADCIDVMRELDTGTVDLILTDPPYLVAFRDRQGRTVANDDNGLWLHPAFREMHRVLKNGGYCISFYAWNRIQFFMHAWRWAGFRVVGHLVFRKRYASSARFLRYQHEMAYLLAKGNPVPPVKPIGDVLDFPFTGNYLHPTQKPIEALSPLIESFSAPGALVLDPFCGSGSTLVAAQELKRDWIGIELDATHYRTAGQRLASRQGSQAMA
jgi:site-specific DNA-methyltransferase (adenine-specific)